MKITAELLYKIYKTPEISEKILMKRCIAYAPLIDAIIKDFEINTINRIGMFLAQIGHESGRLAYVKELWGPTPQQKRYEGRVDLDNTQPGDGFKYRGRGLIQLTGRANYTKYAKLMNLDIVNKPELLEIPENAVKSACWFWTMNKLNAISDKDDIVHATKVINGGQNGIHERANMYIIAKKELENAQ